MKFLKKMNRGLIVFLVLLLAVTIYNLALLWSHSTAKTEIKDVCEKYINTSVNYKMLPEKYRTERPDVPKADLDKYIESMSADLKEFYTDSEQAYKFVISENKANLENQAKGKGVIFSYKKDITKYDKFVFDGNTVKVTILTNSVYNGPNIYDPIASRESIAAQTTETISLQKSGGKWKILYAELQQPMKTEPGNGTVTRTIRVSN